MSRLTKEDFVTRPRRRQMKAAAFALSIFRRAIFHLTVKIARIILSAVPRSYFLRFDVIHRYLVISALNRGCKN